MRVSHSKEEDDKLLKEEKKWRLIYCFLSLGIGAVKIIISVICLVLYDPKRKVTVTHQDDLTCLYFIPYCWILDFFVSITNFIFLIFMCFGRTMKGSAILMTLHTIVDSLLLCLLILLFFVYDQDSFRTIYDHNYELTLFICIYFPIVVIYLWAFCLYVWRISIRLEVIYNNIWAYYVSREPTQYEEIFD